MNARDHALKMLTLFQSKAEDIQTQYTDLIKALSAECHAVSEHAMAQLVLDAEATGAPPSEMLHYHQQQRALKAGYQKWYATWLALRKRISNMSPPAPFDQGWIFIWRLRELAEQLDAEDSDADELVPQMVAVYRTAMFAGASGCRELYDINQMLQAQYRQQWAAAHFDYNGRWLEYDTAQRKRKAEAVTS